MAFERLPPFGVEASTGIGSGGNDDIDDDPDSPDGNWMIASGNNVNTSVRVAFNNPSGNPTTGAGLQEFKCHVRQFDEGQSGTPDIRLELYEGGNLRASSSDFPVGIGGLTFAWVWDATLLTLGPDGSFVECRMVGTKSGGSPTSRNTVDYGAVEWNVEFDEGGAPVQRRSLLFY